MNTIIAVIVALFAILLMSECVNDWRAIRYCQYRLWKREKNRKINDFFEKELRIIKSSIFHDDKQRNKIEWLAARWQSLPIEERIAFLHDCQQQLRG